MSASPAGLGPYALDSIVTGDNAAILAQLPAGCIDLTVTSPPYDNLRAYNGYEWDFEAVAAQLWRVTKDGGVVVWVVADAVVDQGRTGTSFRQALGFMELGFRLHDTMIWHKGTFTSPQTNRYPNSFEYMFVLSKGAPICHQIKDRPNRKAGTRSTHTMRKANGQIKQMYADNRRITIAKTGVRFNVWHIPPEQSNLLRVHPGQFPEALARDHIISWSNPGDTVLDPFCGSGTTLKMALLAGRHFIGIDVSAEYCELSRRRVAEAAARTPEALASGRAKPGGKVDTAGLPLFEALL